MASLFNSLANGFQPVKADVRICRASTVPPKNDSTALRDTRSFLLEGLAADAFAGRQRSEAVCYGVNALPPQERRRHHCTLTALAESDNRFIFGDLFQLLRKLAQVQLNRLPKMRGFELFLAAYI